MSDAIDPLWAEFERFNFERIEQECELEPIGSVTDPSTGEIALYDGTKRDVPGHPDACCNFQHFACEHPEDPNMSWRLYFAGCPKCMVSLQADVMGNPGAIFITHGKSVYSQ